MANYKADDTIVSIVTSRLSNSGVGIIRISGNKSLQIVKKITRKNLAPKIRQAVNVLIYNKSAQVIDNAIAIYFATPNSFTGEDIIELHLHGNQLLLSSVLQNIIDLGARMAEPGEFSKRAYLNEKIDLTQAEAISDLITASSHTGINAAARSLQGKFSNLIQDIFKQIVAIRVEIEAQLDFSEEDVSKITDIEINRQLKNLKNTINNLIQKSEYGKNLNLGITAIIMGPPNAGKSSLLNLFCEETAAIVTDIPGTTRDLIEKIIFIDNLKIKLIDTAGLRETDNQIENIGINLAKDKLKQPIDLLIWIDDITNPSFNSEIKKLNLNKNIKIINILNKIDLIDTNKINNIKLNPNQKLISIKNNIGILDLKQSIKKIFLNDEIFSSQDDIFTARQRHINYLIDLEKYIDKALIFESLEKTAEDLRLAQQCLNNITGNFTADDLLGEIFSNFCIGK